MKAGRSSSSVTTLWAVITTGLAYYGTIKYYVSMTKMMRELKSLFYKYLELPR